MNAKKADPRAEKVALRFPAGKVSKRLCVIFFVFIAVFFVSFSIGLYEVSPIDVIKILLGKIFPIAPTWSPQMETAVVSIRLPRILGAAVVGCSLAVAGCVFQGLFKNPMASPDILGSSAGAGFGAALGLLLHLGYAGTTVLSFAFGLLAVLLACAVAAKFKQNPTLGLILAGMMISSLFTAGISYVKLVADPTDSLPAITYWLIGSLASLKNSDIPLLLIISFVGLTPLFLMRWRLNIMSLGTQEARALGVNTKRMTALIIFFATLLSASGVAVCGMIGWVGLVIPHFARKILGCDYKTLLPASMMLGAAFMILTDDLARTMATSEVPIGILTAFIGAPFFLYMLIKGGENRV